MVADDISAAKGMHANFGAGTFAHEAFATMADIGLVTQVAFFGQDFGEAASGAAGRVFFVPVVHLDDFEVKVGSEDLRRLAGQPKEGIDPDAVVGGKDDGDGFGSLANEVAGGLILSRSADDENFACGLAGGGQRCGTIRQGEIDDGVAVRKGGGKVIVGVDLGGDGEGRIGGSAVDEGASHAPAGTIDKKKER